MKRYVSMLIVMMMLFSSLVPSMAQSSGGAIDLNINQSTFKKGQEVVLSAIVKKDGQVSQNSEVLITVKNELSENIIFVNQLITDEDGKVSARFVIQEKTENGVYVVSASGLGTTGTGKFQVGKDNKSNAIATDKARYKLGETVNITGSLIVDGKVLANRSAIIKVYCKDQLVYVKELLSGDDGVVTTSFVTSKLIGEYTVQMESQGNAFNTSFEVTKKGAEKLRYQIDGSADKKTYKIGETVRVTGTAATFKDDIKTTQAPITVIVKARGKTVTTKTVSVEADGSFSVNFSLGNKNMTYEIVLKNKTAERIIKIKT